ncbi:putative calcium-activated chloride channel regulator 4 [Leptodontidium sp. MPI-SDFR-AT-0119]|nr:putative calcium-activated chloride channel regulator 4 [Leptodontidium sp. MPI-SDFR-AT-0119]
MMFTKALASCLLLTLSTPVLAQDPNCNTAVASNGGRKIGIVVDSSGSMESNDPNDLRITAGKSLTSSLVTGGSHPDQVTVVDFDGSATLLYPLGDPAKAGPSFDLIDSSGGTYIAGGLETAIDELTKGQATTAGVTGIVVLTDGQDSSATLLVEQLNRAQGLGIRVSFGFLSPESEPSDPAVLAAIIATGGVFSTFQNSEALQNFVNAVITLGLTAVDNSSSERLLLPGLTIVGNVSSTATATYVYSPISGEALNFTVQALDSQSLSVKLQDKSASTDVKTESTDANGFASILYTPAVASTLELSISTTNTTTSLFSVSLGSSVNRTFNLCTPNK